MNKYLIDTHLIIWLFFTPQRVPGDIMQLLKRRDIVVFISAVSFWEISIKFKLGKLNLKELTPLDLLDECVVNDFQLLPLDCNQAASSFSLISLYHKDPFDRLLIWQALQKNLIFITDDKMIGLYESEGLRTLW